MAQNMLMYSLCLTLLPTFNYDVPLSYNI